MSSHSGPEIRFWCARTDAALNGLTIVLDAGAVEPFVDGGVSLHLLAGWELCSLRPEQIVDVLHAAHAVSEKIVDKGLGIAAMSHFDRLLG